MQKTIYAKSAVKVVPVERNTTSAPVETREEKIERMANKILGVMNKAKRQEDKNED